MLSRYIMKLNGPMIQIFFTLIFFFARIFELIDWSWMWVFSPLWIPLAIYVAITGVGLIIMALIGIYYIYDEWALRKR